jgi:hypothetical protein
MLQMHTEAISRGARACVGTRTGYAENAGLTRSQGSEARTIISRGPGYYEFAIVLLETRGSRVHNTTRPEQIRSCLPTEQLSDPTAPPSWVPPDGEDRDRSYACYGSVPIEYTTRHLSDITASPNHLPSTSHSAKNPRHSVPSWSPAVSRAPAAVVTGQAITEPRISCTQYVGKSSRDTPHPSHTKRGLPAGATANPLPWVLGRHGGSRTRGVKG